MDGPGEFREVEGGWSCWWIEGGVGSGRASSDMTSVYSLQGCRWLGKCLIRADDAVAELRWTVSVGWALLDGGLIVGVGMASFGVGRCGRVWAPR